MRNALTFLLLIMVTSTVGAQDVVRYFPGAASAPGDKGAFFVTDIRLFNPDSGASLTVFVSFLERDVDGSGALEVPVVLGPRRGAAHNDVLMTLFGRSDVTGALRMRSDGPFFATSRTYSLGGSEGTFGSFIPSMEESEALDQGILLHVANDPADTGFRANVGLMNPGLETVLVTVRVVDAGSGDIVGSGDRSVPPRSLSQIDNVFAFVGMGPLAVDNAVVEFAAEGPVLAYTTVIDNASNDPIYVVPFADSGSAGGQEATFSRVQNEIFTPSCALSGCHSPGSASAGLSLAAGEAFDEIVDVPSTQQGSRDRVEPGSPSQSYLYLKVIGDGSITGAQMPRFRPPLTGEQVSLLEDWIEAGALRN